jgi:hypothetical protein
LRAVSELSDRHDPGRPVRGQAHPIRIADSRSCRSSNTRCKLSCNQGVAACRSEPDRWDCVCRPRASHEAVRHTGAGTSRHAADNLGDNLPKRCKRLRCQEILWTGNLDRRLSLGTAGPVHAQRRQPARYISNSAILNHELAQIARFHALSLQHSHKYWKAILGSWWLIDWCG